MEGPREHGQIIAEKKHAAKKRAQTLRTGDDLDGKTWLRNSIRIWSDIRKTLQEIALKHPAMFPAQLVPRLIESFTRSDQPVILDPFSGIGSTVLTAEMMGRSGIGLEISPEYTAKARTRPPLNPGMFTDIANPSNGQRSFLEADARDLLRHIESSTP